MSDYYFDKLKKEGATEAKLQGVKEQFITYDENFIVRFLFTAFAEMFPVGLIISLISAGLLRKSEFLPDSPTK